MVNHIRCFSFFSQTPRWCYRDTSTSFNTWNSPASGTSNSEASLIGCQNSMTTAYVHNVTADDDNVMFMCEVGDNSLCGFGDVSSNITISLGNYQRNIISLLTIKTKWVLLPCYNETLSVFIFSLFKIPKWDNKTPNV